MGSSIPERSQRPGGSALKRWSWRLVIVGICVEVLCLVAHVSISLITFRFLTDLSHDFIPLFSIIAGLVFLVIYTLLERSLIVEEKTDVQRKLPPQERLQHLEKNELVELKNEQQRQVVQLPPMRVSQLFIVPLEGNNPNECEDKAAVNSAGNRYAVTDGVSQSFMPAQWAEVIARHFVDRATDFSLETEQGREDFFLWLSECSKEWEQWVNNKQLPRLKKEYGWMSWDQQVEQGAQTTFIGCSLFADKQDITLHVTSIGDAYFFLFRNVPPSPPEQMIEMWPPESPQGDNITNTFKTLAAVEADRAQARAWRSLNALQRRTYRAHVGDIIVLVTDKLALWIWQQITMQHTERLKPLFTVRNAESFRQFVFYEREAHTLAHDDTTLFLIPLTNELYWRLSPEPRSTKPVPPK